MVKTLVIDTNVIIKRPDAIFDYPGQRIVIPMTVINELDNIKSQGWGNSRSGKDSGVYSARRFNKLLSDLRKQYLSRNPGVYLRGVLVEGIELENGAVLSVLELHDRQLDQQILEYASSGTHSMLNDARILAHAYALKNQGEDVVLVTNDVSLELKADMHGVAVENPKIDHSINEEQQCYSGIVELAVEDSLLSYPYYRGNEINFTVNDVLALANLDENSSLPKIYPNAGLILKKASGKGGELCFVVAEDGMRVNKLPSYHLSLGTDEKFVPKNVEQAFAVYHMLNPKIKYLFVSGAAGSGKSITALACVLSQLGEMYDYSFITSRMFADDELGFMPGPHGEKAGDKYGGIIFGLLKLISLGMLEDKRKGELAKKSLLENPVPVFELYMLYLPRLTNIRGDSYDRTIVIGDEVQNWEKKSVVTLFSRIESSSKAILLADNRQVDDEKLSPTSNGFYLASQAMIGRPYVAHVSLPKTQRDPAVEEMLELLRD